MPRKSPTRSRIRRGFHVVPRGEELEARALLAAGKLEFSAASYTVQDTAGVVWLDIERIGGSTGTVSVHLTVGSSSNPIYPSGTYGFAAGVTSQKIVFSIASSPVAFLPNGTIPLALSSPTGGATLGNPSTSVLTIVHTPVPGNLDGQKGTQGFVVSGSTADGYVASNFSVIGPDKTVYVLGAVEGHNTAGIPGIVGIAVERYNSDGSVDASYGANGIASIALPTNEQMNFIETGMTLQSDGKIVVAGEIQTSFKRGGVARFNADGSPDTTFGQGGYATFDQPAFQSNYGTGYPSESVAVLSGGQIVIAGSVNTTPVAGSPVTSGDLEPTVLNADGSLDATFGSNGFSMIATNTAVFVNSVLALPDGTFILGGSIADSTSASSERMALWRFNLDGTLDTSFGQEGMALGPKWIGTGPLALEPNGEILQLGGVMGDVYSGKYGIVARYKANGALDTSFGASGSTTLPDYPLAMALGADGEIAVGESQFSPLQNSDPSWENEFILSLLNANGSLISSFGKSGTAQDARRSTSNSDFLAAVSFLPGDEILANGVETPVNNSSSPPSPPNNQEQGYYLGAPLALKVNSLTPATGVPQNNVAIATFTDPGGAGGTSDFSATINWGDGTVVTAAILTPDGSGGYTISGSHTYQADGSYTMTVTLNNAVGVSSSARSTVLAGGPATQLAVTKTPVNATLGGTFTLVIVAEDAAGNPDPNNSSIVSIAPAGSIGATLGGATTATAVNGVATFTGLSLNKIGLGFLLLISAPNLTGTTDTIGVTQPTDDFLGTGASQPAVFRRTNAGVAQWYVKGDPSLTGTGRAFGAGSLDVPLSGDFDGDGKADLVVYRPSTAQWFIEGSASNYTGRLLATFGEAQVDIPVPSNYGGTGDTVAVYRPTTGQWFIKGHSGPITFTSYKAGDIPVPGDYDNVGEDEPAVYRPSTGQWIIDAPTGVHIITFGGPKDIPVPGAYDETATNHSVEPAVWRASTGQLFIHAPTRNRTIQFAVGDVPAPGDFEGIGVTQAAVYRPSTGQWYAIGPTDATPQLFATYGGPVDIPISAPYSYRKTHS